MKKVFLSFIIGAFVASVQSATTITFTIDSKINQGVRINAHSFDVPIVDHIFTDSVCSLIFEGDVTQIYDKAFYGCSSITSIILPKTIRKIGENAFRECSALTNIDIPNTTSYIGDGAFAGCSSLKSIVLPDSLKVMGVALFSHCENLNNVLIPDGITRIESYAFSKCSNITSVFIPRSVRYIGDCVYSNCDALSEIVVDSQNLNYDSREGCNAIIETATNSLLCGCKNTIVPSDILCIVSKAFEGCTALTSIYLPEGLITIESEAFLGCKNLKEINIPESVQSMGYGVFDGCVSFPIEYIPNGERVSFAVYADTYLVHVFDAPKHFVLKPGTRWIGSYAFAGSKELEQIEIPSCIKGIGAKAFEGCYNLPVECGLQYADTYLVGPAYYYDEDEDEYVDVREDIKKCTIRNGTRWIGIGAFSECYALTEVIIPNSVEFIDITAFNECYKLKKINLPNSLVKIGNYSFGGCESLQKIAIPEGVVSIGQGAFWECSSLKQVSLPKTIVSIGDEAFYDCYSLRKLYCSAAMPPSISYGTFGEIFTRLKVYLPASSIESYKVAPIWQSFLSGEEYESNPICIVPRK